jgi:hypothetical protein
MVVRSLSSRELANIYHIPTLLVEELDLSARFWEAVPGQLACHLWMALWPQFEKPSGANIQEGIVKNKDVVLMMLCLPDETDATCEAMTGGVDSRQDCISGSVEENLEVAESGPSFDFSVAVKADNAEIPCFIWDDRVWGLQVHSPVRRQAFQDNFEGQCPLTSLRFFLLRCWRKRLTCGMFWYFRDTYGAHWNSDRMGTSERVLARDCLARIAAVDWWEWKDGSTLLFWRWPPYVKLLAVAGHKPWFATSPPLYKVPQQAEGDDSMRKQVHKKLQVPLECRYIADGHVESLTSFFSVPKGDADVRMVFDASKSGLNASLWVPSFQLPTCETLTDLLSSTSWMSDLDLGEHFHNFPLHEDLQVYCGIDLRPYFPATEPNKTVWRRWTRCMMGLKSSPYFTIQATHFAYEVANGDRHDPKNALRWASVI